MQLKHSGFLRCVILGILLFSGSCGEPQKVRVDKIREVPQTGSATGTGIAGGVLRFMSYNVHNAKGMDGVMDPGRIAGVIREAGADFVALQELDSVTVRSGRRDILKELADSTGLFGIFGGAIDYDGGRYGIGILCKEPPLWKEVIALPGREEKRCLLVAGFKDFVFCCTHFSLTAQDRSASAKKVIERLKDTDRPVFLGGDLNTLPEGEAVGLLLGKDVKTGGAFLSLLPGFDFTFPADKPDRCIDYILGSRRFDKSYRVLGSRVWTRAGTASDHLPVVVDLVIEP